MHSRLLTISLFWFLVSGASLLRADDWPTHLHDNQRSGLSNDRLLLPLHRHWSYQVLSKPRPAWPEPAQQDYWHQKTKLQPRVTYDRAFAIVAARQRVVFGSSADDQVRCLDAETGELLWRFFAEAPVRLAPSIWRDTVLFGADDGFAYCLNLEDGSLRWKTCPEQVGTRRIPGNQRVISQRPIRTGIMIEDGTAYFAAGLFPQQGTFFFSLDPNTGKMLDHAQLDLSPQGYLVRREGRIFAPTGRDPRGAFLKQLAERSEVKTNQLAKQLSDNETFAIVADQDHVFCGRTNQVIAFANNQEQPVWSAEVPGNPYSLAIANGSLYISSDQGIVMRFGHEKAESVSHCERVTKDAKPVVPNDEGTADEYLDGSFPKSGYALIIEPKETDVAKALSRESNLQVIMTTASEGKARSFREDLFSTGLYGRVVVHVAKDKLPYAPRLFNVVIGGEEENVLPLLVPGNGIAFCGDRLLRQPVESKIGEWSHMYAGPGNTACSNDPLGGPLKLQWFGRPGPRHMVDRHMRTMPPLSSNGRLFVPGLDRIIAVDAYNGAIQWEKSLPGSTRIGILKDAGWMVADKEHLYVARGSECLLLRADTGEQIHSIAVPRGRRDWGYIARVGDQLVGSTTWPQASRRTINRDAILDGAYSDDRPFVCCDALFSWNASMTQPLWDYEANGAILHPTIAANAAQLFFVQSRARINEENGGRIPLQEFLDGKTELICLDLASGKTSWRVPVEISTGAQSIYILCNEKYVIAVNSRNDQTVHYDTCVRDVATGNEIWSATQDNKNEAGGDHGEQDKHPVLVGNKLIVEPHVYDVASGTPLKEFDLGKRGSGCGTLSASARALFFRSSHPASFQLDTKEIVPVTTVSRPGCWINMIPANGLLLIPEASAGCTCNFPIQTSMAFAAE